MTIEYYYNDPAAVVNIGRALCVSTKSLVQEFTIRHRCRPSGGR